MRLFFCCLLLLVLDTVSEKNDIIGETSILRTVGGDGKLQHSQKNFYHHLQATYYYKVFIIQMILWMLSVFATWFCLFQV